jgi:L-fuconolactonase
MRIDAHTHFWQYAPDQYAWLPDEQLKRDFRPADLQPLLKPAGVDAVIAVEARAGEPETATLLNLAHQHAWIAGVVGWAPLASPDVRPALERFKQSRHFVGVRQSWQHRPDGYLQSEELRRGLGHLKHLKLTYDLLITHRQLPAATDVVDQHPNQVFVLDHLGKPDIANDTFMPWADDLRRLAERPNVYAKLSGLVTEADWGAWTPGLLRPYYDAALDCFGPGRLLWGSDWPVCLSATDYARWADTVEGWAAGLSDGERQRLFGGTAVAAYGLKELPHPSDRVEPK